MLRISRTDKKFDRLDNPTLSAASILERSDLQEYIFNSSKDFFAELGEELLVLGKEIQPSDTVQDRIDLLALDKEGGAVIIELKRGNDKFQLLQAIAYAGMVAQWSGEEFQSHASEKLGQLGDWLDVELAELNRTQRILLIAEAFDYEVLAAAEWLYEKYNVEIACARLSLAVDGRTGAEYLSCTQIFPTPELAEQALIRGRRPAAFSQESIGSWEDFLAKVRNPDIASFVRTQLEAGCENRIKGQVLFFRVNGKRRLGVEVRLPHATVWQTGRFTSDIEFWRARLTDQAVEPVDRGLSLRFFLRTAEDCSRFLSSLQDLGSKSWDTDNTLGVVQESGVLQPA